MTRVAISILLMAVTTYLIRVIPLLFIKKEIKNKYFKSFIYYVPYVCLASMTFPAIIYSTGNTITGIIGLLTAVLCSYKNMSMVKVASITCLIVFVCEELLSIL